MSKAIDLNPDFVRALHLLRFKIKSPHELITIWSAFGPCIEIYPEIERIRKKS